jgi:hypothetical protein
MEPAPFTYQFEAVVERFQAKGGWHFVRFPYPPVETLGSNSPVRVHGTVNGVAYKRTLMPIGDGTHMLPLDATLRKVAKLVQGSSVRVVMIKGDIEDFTVPEELLGAFTFDEAAQARFAELTAGYRRRICQYIAEPKTAETRINRAAEVLGQLQRGEIKPKGPSLY